MSNHRTYKTPFHKCWLLFVKMHMYTNYTTVPMIYSLQIAHFAHWTPPPPTPPNKNKNLHVPNAKRELLWQLWNASLKSAWRRWWCTSKTGDKTLSNSQVLMHIHVPAHLSFICQNWVLKYSCIYRYQPTSHAFAKTESYCFHVQQIAVKSFFKLSYKSDFSTQRHIYFSILKVRDLCAT